jgi:hypothetical protein
MAYSVSILEAGPETSRSNCSTDTVVGVSYQKCDREGPVCCSDIQWERLVSEKEKAVAELEEKHQKQMELIKTELEMAIKNSSSMENEVTN